MASYDDLYIDILKIGRQNVTTGLSYNTLKTQLVKKGYDFSNDCIELAVKQWFYDSFHHKGENFEAITTLELDKHLDCNFIMKGDACLKLTGYETSKRNVKLMIASVVIAVVAILISLFSSNITTSKSAKQNVESTN